MDPKETKGFQVEDRRFWVNDEEALDRAPIPEKKYPSYIEELKSRTELAEQRLKDKMRKLDEENEAFRERLTRDMERRLEREKQTVLLGFLEVVDNLERALMASADLVSLKDGLRLNIDLFLSRLKAHGVEPIDPINEPFDPHEAEAVGVVAVDKPDLDHRVVEVVQKGYRLGDQLVRPARVRVGQYTAA
jgi:molecular chaperone GrpE